MLAAHHLAIALPAPAVTLAAVAVLALVVIAAFIVIRKSGKGSTTASVWAAAANELGLEFDTGASEFGPVGRGTVNNHFVTFAPLTKGKGRKATVNTVYSVKYDAPDAPKFTLVRRTEKSDTRLLNTGNDKFDRMVAVETKDREAVAQFFTAERRGVIVRLLTSWPNAELTNHGAHATTAKLETDESAIVDAICHLVALGETFDRPTITRTQTARPEPVSTPTDAPTPEATQAIHGDTDVMTMVRLDEQSVIRELFDAELSASEIQTRFAQLYQGREVTWSGEIVRVGIVDESGLQRIAVLVGSANGQDPESGRVVAITTTGPTPVFTQGDIATFTGTLANLNPDQRLFHLT